MGQESGKSLVSNSGSRSLSAVKLSARAQGSACMLIGVDLAGLMSMLCRPLHRVSLQVATGFFWREQKEALVFL